MSYIRLDDLSVESRKLPPGLLRLPMVKQQTEFSCGPAALLSVLQYWGVRVGDERDLYRQLKTGAKGGTRPKLIAAAARQFGLDATARQLVTHDDLYWATKRGETVILSLQRWGANLPDKECDDGHFVVLSGVTDTNDDSEDVGSWTLTSARPRGCRRATCSTDGMTGRGPESRATDALRSS